MPVETLRFLGATPGASPLEAPGMTWLTAAAAFMLAEDVGVGGRHGSILRRTVVVDSDKDHCCYGDVFPLTTGWAGGQRPLGQSDGHGDRLLEADHPTLEVGDLTIVSNCLPVTFRLVACRRRRATISKALTMSSAQR